MGVVSGLLRREGVGVAAAAALVLGMLPGCASAPHDGAELDDEEVSDPLEAVNRPIFAVNQTADTFVLRPIAVAYRTVVPPPLQANLHNFLNWISLPLVFIHDMLQGEWERAEVTAARFVINLNVLGLGDIASDLGRKPQHSEDAGQTLAVWGLKNSGPYLVLPLLGPSNLRDAAGLGIDALIDPAGFALGTTGSIARAGARGVDFRARNMEEIDDLQRTAIDYYAAVRSLYRQRRASEIRNGAADDLPPGPGLGLNFDRRISLQAQGRY